MTPTIAVVRETTLLTDAQVLAYVKAQQTQITRDFLPIWNMDATIVFIPQGQVIPPDAWQVLLLNDSDQAGALGYHDNLGPSGEPRSKIFVADDLQDGVPWTITPSHEILEMRADPNANLTVKASQNGIVYEYAYEICDGPEDDHFSYDIDGITLSAFVTPAWFDLNAKGPFVFPATVPITAPFALAEGGYIGVREVSPTPTNWTQRMAMGAPGRRALNKAPTSRTMRRFNAVPGI